MKYALVTLPLTVLVPALYAQEDTPPTGQAPIEVVDTTAPEQETVVVDTTPAPEQETVVVDTTTAPETPEPTPSGVGAVFTGQDIFVSDLTGGDGSQADDQAGDDTQLQNPQDADELAICSGISMLRGVIKDIASARNTKTANEAAAKLQADLDRLQEWSKGFHESMQNGEVAQLYKERYQHGVEELCLNVAELAVYLSNSRYHLSDDLRQALLRTARELPQDFHVGANVQWSTSGLILLSMLNESLSRVADTGTAKAAVNRVQEVLEALKPWREAAKAAREAAAKEGKAAKRTYISNCPSLAADETFHVKSTVEQYYLGVRTHAKRISYAGSFYADALTPLLLQADGAMVDICALSEAEHHICTGIVLLGTLENILARVKDTESARAAVAPIMQLTSELQKWGQGFAALPEPEEDMARRYEKTYIPRIEQINLRIKSQAERISSASYYGSRELFETLKSLIRNFQ